MGFRMNRKEYKAIVIASWVFGAAVLLCLDRSRADTLLSLSLLTSYSVGISLFL